MSKICLGKKFWVVKKPENNCFRVPIQFATNRFTFEKNAPLPPLLHPINNINPSSTCLRNPRKKERQKTRGWGRLETRPPVALGSAPVLSMNNLVLIAETFVSRVVPPALNLKDWPLKSCSNLVQRQYKSFPCDPLHTIKFIFPKLICFFYVETHKASDSSYIRGGLQVWLHKKFLEVVHSARSSCTADAWPLNGFENGPNLAENKIEYALLTAWDGNSIGWREQYLKSYERVQNRFLRKWLWTGFEQSLECRSLAEPLEACAAGDFFIWG